MIDKLIHENLLLIVDAYRRATGKSLAQCSKELYGNGDFFLKLRRGDVAISTRKLAEMIEELRTRWPADARWPVTRVIAMNRRAA
jgi:hypothetical protein